MRERAIPVQVARLMLTLLLVVSPSAAAVHAQDREQVEKDASEIYNTLLSPFCPGRLIANCPSSQAADLRTQIRDRLEAGASKDEVIDELYAVWETQARSGRGKQHAAVANPGGDLLRSRGADVGVRHGSRLGESALQGGEGEVVVFVDPLHPPQPHAELDANPFRDQPFHDRARLGQTLLHRPVQPARVAEDQLDEVVLRDVRF